MPTAEAARARELLVSNTAGTTGGLVDDGGKISANVFHTRSLVKIVKRPSSHEDSEDGGCREGNFLTEGGVIVWGGFALGGQEISSPFPLSEPR